MRFIALGSCANPAFLGNVRGACAGGRLRWSGRSSVSAQSKGRNDIYRSIVRGALTPAGDCTGGRVGGHGRRTPTLI